MSAAVPFIGLAPECILDALESIGFRCDGGLMALNSYENRVWQIGMEDSAPLIAKFYRPGRWSDAQIAEEHAFVAAMRTAELPVIAPLVIDGQTLFTHTDAKTDSIFRFAVYPRQSGRAPEFDNPQVLQWMGRLMARIHLIGEREPFLLRETLDIHSFGIEPCNWLLDNQMLPPELESIWHGVA
ncbi:MAG TPA: serine/threonine protein kinase, partial [Rugosibacter sp.]